MSGKKEQAVLDMVKQTTPPGDPQAVLDAIDNFAWSRQGFLMNIGDVKGAILDSVIDQYHPTVSTSLLHEACGAPNSKEIRKPGPLRSQIALS